MFGTEVAQDQVLFDKNIFKDGERLVIPEIGTSFVILSRTLCTL